MMRYIVLITLLLLGACSVAPREPQHEGGIVGTGNADDCQQQQDKQRCKETTR